ncbi:hypothetical protein GGR42_003421 [Saonia flava]|uniref:Uncharacterized protein n=1 Tax=Saonia flava TaxID=523696 RepID=A0A846R3F9_9FLAO|nr:DUF6090 family protein [Saonia flava]NJB72923.1 hypothetical protein [Saonia flava]
MIKFFRKIRQKLLTENKFSKYLIYAIGEIILVVIGILIALQINNWNEHKKQKIKEINTLESINESLKQDKIQLEGIIPYNDKIRNSIDFILNHFNEDLPYDNSLDSHFAFTSTLMVPNFQTSAFETLKSEGVNLISNSTLRNSIIQFYDSGIKSTDWQTETYRNVIMDASKNIFNKRFNSFWESNYDEYMEKQKQGQNVSILEIKGAMKPNNYELLKKDNEYVYFLKSLKNINSWHMDRMFKLELKEIEKLIQNIETEVKILKTK